MNRLKKFLARPDLHLILLVVTGHSALSGAGTLVRIYREGVPASPGVAVAHVLTVVLWGLFLWQMERLEKHLKVGYDVRATAARWLARKRAEQARVD